MSQKAKSAAGQPVLVVNGEVARQVRQHARASPSAEICGVLIGHDRPGRIEVQACIAGANAEEAGAHVTFTQDTWEHIYQVKDKQYPNQRIVGWYHSHPGFGVFLSDHDAFIHKNFFASPGQVAWVYDPHSDEEGCFGWMDGRIERLSQIVVSDQRGGEQVQESGCPEPLLSAPTALSTSQPKSLAPEFLRGANALETGEDSSNDSLRRLTTTVFSYITVLLLGFLIAWYFFPRVEVLPVPVDPMTGKPLPGYSLEATPGNPAQSGSQPSGNQGNDPANQSTPPDASGNKENHGQPK
jgi:proteasome lid subunit RPN8/RPN11